MRTLSLFPNRRPPARSATLQDKTIAGFDGGLDLSTNDITLPTKFAKVLDNVVPGNDGSLSIRWGTNLFADVNGTVSGDILEIVDFNGSLLVFTDDGEIARITSAGVKTAIWNTAIAAALVGAPAGWTAGTHYVDTSEFKGSLIAVNGQDKPIIITSSFAVSYLQDIPTGSNVNVPIGQYVTTVANYLIIAGISGATGSIYISSSGTSGTWPGDPAPNDSLSYNLASFVPENSGSIIGLASYRNQLIVAFEGAIVVVTLGEYDSGGNHVPAVQDNIVEHGVINFRTMVTAEQDLIMSDITGWHIAQKNAFGQVETVSNSEQIEPEYSGTIALSTSDRAKAFSVYNKLEKRITTFVVDANGDWVGWTASARGRSFRKPAYSKARGLDFACGCGTLRGRVFFALGSSVYQYGNDAFANEDYTGDRIGEYDSNWVTATPYVVGDLLKDGSDYYEVLVDHTSSTIDDDEEAGNIRNITDGQYIDFDWLLPWQAFGSRSRKKRLLYTQLDTSGTAQFTMQVFPDNVVYDSSGDYDPAISVEFTGGDSQGFGNNDQPYGGGRRTRDERPWKTPVDFKIAKYRIFGSTNKPLRLVTLTSIFLTGKYRR